MAMNIMNGKQRRENLGDKKEIYSKGRIRHRFALLFDFFAVRRLDVPNPAWSHVTLRLRYFRLNG